VNFYERQAAARRQSRWLLLGFVVAVAAVVLVLDVVLITLLAGSDEYGNPLGPIEGARRYPGLAVGIAVMAAGVILIASLYKSLAMREGGGVVARTLGGVRLDRDTLDLRRKRLHNVVEEMAIASGVPMPEVYVLEQESAINAFAAGHTPANAAIAVTQGALERLSREELQGVIAHELSHVLNGDMRLNVRLLGWVFGLFAITLVGRTILRLAARTRKNGVPFMLVALAIMVIGYVGSQAGRLLQAAVSRQRERLADASAVQFTRNPEGLKGALIKIGGFDAGSRLSAVATEQVAHMLFAPGLRRLFATHPPLIERIKALDPRFRAQDLPGAAAVLAQISTTPELEPGVAAAAPAAIGTPPVAVAAAPRAIAAQVGHPQTVHVRYAQAVRLQLPEALREFVETTGRARTLVLALLLGREQGVRARQLRAIGDSLGDAAVAEVEAVAPLAYGLAPFLRLPAVSQVFPALRRLTPPDQQALSKVIDVLVTADARVEVFEYCLARLVTTGLRDLAEARAPHGRSHLDRVSADLGVLFAVIAHAGASDERQARQAYEAGMQKLLPRHRPEYLVPPNWPAALDVAFSRLEALHPVAKEALIEALVRTIAHDAQLGVAEAELLRTVCAILHCPLPPLLPATVAQVEPAV
jgi:Zn-dependent protease with chaperone function